MIGGSAATVALGVAFVVALTVGFGVAFVVAAFAPALDVLITAINTKAILVDIFLIAPAYLRLATMPL